MKITFIFLAIMAIFGTSISFSDDNLYLQYEKRELERQNQEKIKLQIELLKKQNEILQHQIKEKNSIDEYNFSRNKFSYQTQESNIDSSPRYKYEYKPSDSTVETICYDEPGGLRRCFSN